VIDTNSEEWKEKKATLVAYWVVGMLMLGMLVFVPANAEATTTGSIYAKSRGYNDASSTTAYISCWYQTYYTRYNMLSFNLGSIPNDATITDVAVYDSFEYTTLSGTQMTVHAINAFGFNGSAPSLMTSLSVWQSWYNPGNTAYNITMGDSLDTYYHGHGTESIWQTQFDNNKTIYVGFSTLYGGTTTGSWGNNLYGDASHSAYIVVTYTAPSGWAPTITSSSSGHTTAYIGLPYSYHMTANESVTWAINSFTSPTVWSTQLLPTADAYTISSAPNTNTGTSTTLEVDETLQGTNYMYWTFMRWNLTTIPAGAHITNAYLKMFLGYQEHPELGQFKFLKEPASTAWSENGITWNTQPTYTGGPYFYGARGSVSGTGWKNFTDSNITSMVHDQFDSDARTSLALIVENPSDVYNVANAFHSKESTTSGGIYRPYLQATYTYPNWLSIDSGGYLNGTATYPGTYHVNVSANSSAGGSKAYQDFDIVVSQVPIIDSTPITSVIMTHAYSYAVTTEDGTISLDSTNASWLTFTTGNNTLWGRAPYGKHSYYVHLNNSYNQYQNFTLSVGGWMPTFLYYNNYGGGGLTSHLLETKYDFMFIFNETSSFILYTNASFLSTEIHSDHIYIYNSLYPSGTDVTPVGWYYINLFVNSTNGHMPLWYNYTLTLYVFTPISVVFSTTNNTVFFIGSTGTIFWNDTAGTYPFDHFMQRGTTNNGSSWSSWNNNGGYHYLTYGPSVPYWYRIQVYAVDDQSNAGPVSEIWFRFIIKPHVTITSVAVTTYAQGGYHYTVTTNITATISITMGPPWMTLGGYTLGGVSQEGHYTVVIMAHDTVYNSWDNQTFALTITPYVYTPPVSSPLWQMVIPFIMLVIITILSSISRDGISGSSFLGSMTIGIFILAWAGALGIMTFGAIAFGALMLAIMLFRAYREAT
jgi:hypothetical protein